MYRSKFTFWQATLAGLTFLLCYGEAGFAQSPNGFSKSGRGSRPAASSSRRPPQNFNRGGQTRGNSSGRNRSSSRSYSQSSSRNRSRQFNHHSFSPSRTVTGTGFSTGHFRGVYVPLAPYGYSNSFRSVTPLGFGFGGPIYQDPYALGFGYSNPGFQNFNPAYSTYGSSVAAQALERHRNQQQIVPPVQSANDPREAEILRLQIELERARQALANQQQPQQQQTQPLKPPVQDAPSPSNQEVIDKLGLAAIIETNQLAAASHLKAERAFRAGDYGQAARFSGLSKSLDESNGKLMLFASQAHFANGEYRESVAVLTDANSLLQPEEMGWVIENFKLFYGQNDFVAQMKALSAHIKQSPSDADAWMLRGYQYGALGYPEAARKDFARAKEQGANSDLIETLINRFSNLEN